MIFTNHILTYNLSNVYVKYKTIYAQFGHSFFLLKLKPACIIAQYNEIKQIINRTFVAFLQKYVFHVEKHLNTIYNQIKRKIYQIWNLSILTST